MSFGVSNNKFYKKEKYKLYMRSLRQRHFFHMVTPSPWPFFIALHIFILVLGGVLYMHTYNGGGYLILWGIFNILYIVNLWLRDVIREGTFEGMHTLKVQKNLKTGFALFIITEIMFFFGFFWAFFHCSLAPSIEIGCVWPPVGIIPINPWKLPLFNTFLLLQSGIYITICHMFMRIGSAKKVYTFYINTLICGLLFTIIQVFEYIYAPFTISDGIYGSTFYMLTGFHGFHVLAGSIFIIVCLVRTILGHFTRSHHVGFECAAWYWHFVDVVWLFLFVCVYVWGSWGFF